MIRLIAQTTETEEKNGGGWKDHNDKRQPTHEIFFLDDTL